MTPTRTITVRSRLGAHEGQTDGTVAVFDRLNKDADREVRHYILLDESVKLVYEPWSVGTDKWYVDLVDVSWEDDSTLVLEDLYIDVWVIGNGPAYEVIDLDDLANALATGELDPDRLREPLIRFQAFLDLHLNRGTDDFPPSYMKPFIPDGRKG